MRCLRLAIAHRLVGDHRGGDRRGQAERDERVDRRPTGISARQATQRRQARAVERARVAQAEAKVAGVVERDAAEQGDAGHGGERLVHVRERLLDAQRDQHDARDDRQVQVAVGVARHAQAVVPRRPGGSGSRRPARPRRSTPTRARRRRPARAPKPTRMPASRSPSMPAPIATIDSPRAMITISEKRSAKCPAATRNPRTPKTNGPPSRSRAPTIQSAARGAAVVDQARRDQQQRRGQRRAREAHDRLAGVHVLVGLGEDEDVQPAHRGVGDAEQQRVIAEGLGDRQRGDQQGAHDTEHQQPLQVLLGRDVVG